MDYLHRIRAFIMPTLIALPLICIALGVLIPAFFWGVLVTAPLLLLGIYDRVQSKHSLLRNYPVLGRMRFLLEGAGPELHQYFVESNTSGRPFDRDYRTLIYERSKDIGGVKPFGTELDVYGQGYGYIAHSIVPKPMPDDPARTVRVGVGGSECRQPYSASVVNISGMSFGALSGNAIRALNTSAKLGGFAHNTGEGGLSVHHRDGEGDVIWQIGTGYYGCRNDDGTFNAEMFSDQASVDQVKMVELKISQGAKPGHGGILPGAKVTAEIADARIVPMGEDCFSPPGHSAFSTPLELCEFLALLRERSEGKPVGFKLCIGRPIEFFAICKAIAETRIIPDFITVDGGEGGTGAAPQEFSDHLGMPLREGLLLVRNALTSIGVRDEIRIAASGKCSSTYEIASAMALGASWCNIARGFMFSVGCIQSQACHTNGCPVGVATQDKRLQKALVVEDKARRAYNFHRNTVHALAEMTAACGLDHPNDFTPGHINERVSPHEVRRYDHLYELLEPDEPFRSKLPLLQQAWDDADPKSFGIQ